MTDVSNKTFLIKSSPTFPSTDVSTHKTFSSGDSTFSQLTIYSDGEIWYGNDTVAYANGEWEIEYRYLTFGANQQMDDSDYAKFLQVYEVFAENPKKLYFRIGQNGEYKLGSVNDKIKGVWGGTPFDNAVEQWDTPTISLNGDILSTEIVEDVTKYKIYDNGVYIGYVDSDNVWHGEVS